MLSDKDVSLLMWHILDTVIYVIAVIKVSKTGRYSLSKVGVDNADMKSVEAQATNFICAIAT